MRGKTKRKQRNRRGKKRMSSKMASTSSSSSSAGSSPHLCLRWNNYQSNLTSVFDQLLQNETFVDVTLAADGHAIKAHRMVLSACSPYFQHLFFDNPCQHPIVILKDTRWPELKAIVEYMYRGEISVAQEELTSLLRVAETLKIRGLSELNSDRHAAAAAADDRSESSPLASVHPTNLAGPSSSSSSGPAAVRRQTQSPSWSSLPQHQGVWPSHVMDEEMATTPSPTPAPASRSSGVKRRRVSGSESPLGGASSPAAASTPGMHHQHHEEASLDHHDGPLSLVGHQQQPPPPPPHSPVAAPQALTQAPPPSSLQHPLAHSDDLDIKPGIAELIREEERARMLEGTHPWLTASPSVLSESLVQWRSKAPSWSKETLQEAINSIVTQKMRFTQASSHFNIPKGTLYDNILGKSKRMLVLDELGLDAQDEEAVLDFCCETSVMPYNRRTNKSLESIVAFVEKLKQSKGQPSFKLGNLMGFRWWWAFCKKHNIVSLFYVKNNNNNKSSKNKNNNNNRSSPSSASSGSSNNNNLSPSPPDELIPENLSKPFEEELPVGGGNHMAVAAAAAASAFRSINNNNIHLSQAFQLSHAFLLQQQRQNHRHNLRSRTHSVDHDQGDESDPEPENLSVHRG